MTPCRCCATLERHIRLLHNVWSEASGLFRAVSLCGLLSPSVSTSDFQFGRCFMLFDSADAEAPLSGRYWERKCLLSTPEMLEYVRKPLRGAQQRSRGKCSRNKPGKQGLNTWWSVAWNLGRKRRKGNRWLNCTWKDTSQKSEENGKRNCRGIVTKCTLIRRRREKSTRKQNWIFQEERKSAIWSGRTQCRDHSRLGVAGQGRAKMCDNNVSQRIRRRDRERDYQEAALGKDLHYCEVHSGTFYGPHGISKFVDGCQTGLPEKAGCGPEERDQKLQSNSVDIGDVEVAEFINKSIASGVLGSAEAS